MLWKILCKTAVVMLFACAMCISASALDVIIDGERVQFDDNSGYPFIRDSRTLVPLRATMEAYGASVSWDDGRKEAIVTLDETTVVCPTRESCIYRNGTRIPADVGADIIDGRTYLPIRAVLEAFDAVVGYDGNVLVTRPEAKSLVKRIESGAPGSANFWGKWSEAMGLFNSGNYSEAAKSFTALAPTILKYDSAVNAAMLYNHLGFCYENMGNGDFAAECFLRESELWEMAGQHQSAIAAERKAKYTHTTVQMFATTTNEEYNARRFTDGDLVPETGILAGVTLKGNYFGYLDSFREMTDKPLGAGLIYCTPSEGIRPYAEVFRKGAENDIPIQIGLQPVGLADLASITYEDERYVRMAKDIDRIGTKTYVRFACEMNDPTSAIFTNDYELYKEKFRIVADIFHKYAPTCVMVWSPNFSPEDTMELYYPGDEWVDIVGISAYAAYMPETDPLEQGIDRSRFGALLNKIVSLYGYKKPIMISECGASYRDPRTGADITDFASRQINEFFTYLPIKYPQVCAMFLFETVDAAGTRKFSFDNATYRKAASKPLLSDAYLDDYRKVVDRYSYELGNNVRVPAEEIKLHAFAETLHNDFSYVVYRLNDVDVGVAYGIPYTVDVDLSPYAGTTVKLTCLAFDSKQKLCASRSINIVVDQQEEIIEADEWFPDEGAAPADDILPGTEELPQADEWLPYEGADPADDEVGIAYVEGIDDIPWNS